MGEYENKLKWCINKARRELGEGKKHRGVMVIVPNKSKAKQHIEKALRNLDVAELLLRNNYYDWNVVALFYAMYHSLLAVLANSGYESRNQECTFATVLALINNGKINISAEKIKQIKNNDSNKYDDIVNMREYFQYEVGTEIQRIKMEELRKEAQTLILEVRKEIGV